MNKRRAAANIARIGYQPPAGYGLDIEIFKFSELKRRVTAKHLRVPQRVDFHILIYVADGRCTHMVDFESLPCKRGTLLVLSPGQVQRFDGESTHWEGCLVIVRPEFLQGRSPTTVLGELEDFNQLLDLPVHRTLSANQQEAVQTILDRMAADARLQGDTKVLQSLLRHQLLALIVRLHLIQESRAHPSRHTPVSLQRFTRYRRAVEQQLSEVHRVADYAKLIGCSQKSLNRAAVEIAGVSAKAYLSQRIALEAKRLLVHTTRPVAAIAEQLGFDEATNFVKFFRRETGQAPGGFRRQHT